MVRFFIYVLNFLFFTQIVLATTYFTDSTISDCNDYNPETRLCGSGTYQAYDTINEANYAAKIPGDIVYVREGTYEERISIRNSGSLDNYINFVGYPGDSKPVMRGFEIAENYVRIIGFEITHDTLDYNRGIIVAYEAHHVEILDNYIHNTRGHGVYWNHNYANTNITVRDNYFYFLACPNVSGSCVGNGAAVAIGAGSNILVEYNHVERAGDFVNILATYSIIRNNYMHDFNNDYWSEGPGDSLHADMFQPVGNTERPADHQIYESNFMGDNVESNSHILQMRDSYDVAPYKIFRGNVGYNHGSYAMQCAGVDNVYVYGNTIHDINNLNPDSGAWGYNDEGTNPAENAYNFNNVISDGGASPILIWDGHSSHVTASNNLCYQTGSHSSCVETSDPDFADSDNHEFYLRSDSPAIDAGKAITIVTSSSGSGNSFTVQDADFFSDGYDLVEGDLISIGESNMVRIVSITGNIITVDSSISWNLGVGVFWRNQDMNPDIGAYEYDSSGYDFDIAISNIGNLSNVTESVDIELSVTNADKVRFVIFYIDGIPVYQDYDYPFEYTWDASSEAEGSRHFIEAKAYNLYASDVLTKSDFIEVFIGEKTSPICGNSILEDNEECDDGNTLDGDGCDSACQNETTTPVCGNNILEAGEACDGSQMGNYSCDYFPGYTGGSITCMEDCSTPDLTDCLKEGSVINSSTCSSEDVQAAIDSANDGDTVIIPAGDCTWNEDDNIWNGAVYLDKDIVLRGQGEDTIIRWNGEQSAIFTDFVGARITGLHFIFNEDQDTIGIAIKGQGWRIDDCIFENFVTDTIEGVSASTSSGAQHPVGLIDNNIFINTRALVLGSTSVMANDRWVEPLDLGTNNAVFIENNFFNRSNGNCIDSNYGGKYVFRFNDAEGCYVEAHSVQGENRASRSWEIYNNTLDQEEASIWVSMSLRGGTGVIFDNTLTGDWDSWERYINFDNRRSFETRDYPPGICNGTSDWDGNLLSNGYPCRDQIGRSTDEYLWAGEAPYPAQSLYPVFLWNNKHEDGENVEVNIHNDCDAWIVENRDYYVDTISFDSEHKTYSSIFTDDNKSTIQWSYKPYPYPHPLSRVQEELNSSEKIHDADINSDGIIDLTELNSYVQSWKITSDISLADLVDVIKLWKGV
ncbi:MAG: DUF4215 domain-containing protein [Candidatus Woesearchaeota archaeon]